jgi:hypothetical protein
MHPVRCTAKYDGHGEAQARLRKHEESGRVTRSDHPDRSLSPESIQIRFAANWCLRQFVAFWRQQVASLTLVPPSVPVLARFHS